MEEAAALEAGHHAQEAVQPADGAALCGARQQMGQAGKTALLVAEATATLLAGRSADRAAAKGLDALLGELTTDLDAAVAAEEELGGI